MSVVPFEDDSRHATLTGGRIGKTSITVTSAGNPAASRTIAVTVVSSATAALQAQLNAAVKTHGAVTLDKPLTLTEDLTVPAGVRLRLSINRYPLVVPSGKTLTVNGGLEITNPLSVERGGTLAVGVGAMVDIASRGELQVAGTLTNNGYIEVYESGTLNVEAAHGGLFRQSGGSDSELIQRSGSVVNGVDENDISYTVTLYFWSAPEATMREAFSHTDYRRIVMRVNTDMTLAADMTIPANATLQLYRSLTVPAAATLTNRGSIVVDSTFQVAGGLDNTGYIRVAGAGVNLNVETSGSLTNVGTIEVRSMGTLACAGTYDSRGNRGRILLYDGSIDDGIDDRDITKYVDAASADLVTKLNARGYCAKVVTLTNSHTFTEDIAISSAVTLNVGHENLGATAVLRVPAGKTLYLNGALYISSKGKLVVEAGATVRLGTEASLTYDGVESRLENRGSIEFADSGSLGFGDVNTGDTRAVTLSGDLLLKTGGGMGYTVEDPASTDQISKLITLGYDLGPAAEDRYRVLDAEAAEALGIESVVFSPAEGGSDYIAFQAGWGSDTRYSEDIHAANPYVFFLTFTSGPAVPKTAHHMTVMAQVIYTDESGKAPAIVAVNYTFDNVPSEVVPVSQAILDANYDGSLQAFFDSADVPNNSAHPVTVDMSGETYNYVTDLTIKKHVTLTNGTINGNIILSPLGNEPQRFMLGDGMNMLAVGGAGIGVKATGPVAFAMLPGSLIQGYDIGVDLRGAGSSCQAQLIGAHIASCAVAVYMPHWCGAIERSNFTNNGMVFKFSGTGSPYTAVNNSYQPRRCTFVDNAVIVDPNGKSGHNYDLRYNYLATNGAVTNDAALAAVSYVLPGYTDGSWNELTVAGAEEQASGGRASVSIDPDPNYLAPVTVESMAEVLNNIGVDTLELDLEGVASWSFDGNFENLASLPPTVDLAVDGNITPEMQVAINNLGLPGTAQVLNFSHSGYLPYRADVTVPTDFPAGVCTLYEYSGGALSPAFYSDAVSDGSGLTVTLDHCSSYVAVCDPLAVRTYKQLTDAIAAGQTQIRVTGAFALGGNVTLPAGTTLYVAAKLSTGAFTLTVGENAKLTVESLGTLAILARGKLDVRGEFDMQDGALTCASGGRLVNNNYIRLDGGVATFAAGSTFENHAQCTVDGVGRLVIDGTYIEEYDPALQKGAVLELNGRSDADVSGKGITPAQVMACFELNENQSANYDIDLRDMVQEAARSEWPCGYIRIRHNVKSICDLVIPAGYTLQVSGRCTLDMDAYTLIVNGTLDVYSGSTLTTTGRLELRAAPGSGESSCIFGTLNVSGTGVVAISDDSNLNICVGGEAVLAATAELENYGNLTVEKSWDDGPVSYGRLTADENTYVANYGTIWVFEGCNTVTGILKGQQTLYAEPTTPAELTAQLALDGYTRKVVRPKGDIVLADNACIENGVDLYLGETDGVSGHLTVPAGKTLTVEGGLSVEAPGRLTVDGTVRFGTTCWYDIDEDCVDGTGAIEYPPDAPGITSLAELQAAIAAHVYDISIYDAELTSAVPVTVHIPAGTQMYIYGGMAVDRNVTLIVDGMARLFVYGALILDGGVLVNDGYIEAEIGAIVDYGTFTNNGDIMLYKTLDGGTLTQAIVDKAIADGAVYMDIYGEVRTSGSGAIPNNIPLNIHGTLYVSRGTTLTCDYNVTVYGTLEFIAGSKCAGGPIQVIEGGTLITNGVDVRYEQQGVAVRSIQLDIGTPYNDGGDTHYYIGLDTRTPVSAMIVPGNAWNTEVKLHSNVLDPLYPDPETSNWWGYDEDGNLWMQVNEADIRGLSSSTVDVWATAVDNGVESNRLELQCTDCIIEVAGPGGAQQDVTLMAGKTLQFTGTFLPSNLTNTKLVWSLEYKDPDNQWVDCPAGVAVINSASGIVTAKPVLERYELRAIAEAADGTATEGSLVFELLPYAASIAIESSQTYVDWTGTTQIIDLNSGETWREVRASILPFDAGQEATWKSSNPLVATVEESGINEAVVTGLSVSATPVTITATATDGSKKFASFKVLVTKRAKAGTLEMTQLGGTFGSDDANWTVTAGKTAKAQAVFTSDVPTSTKLVWSVSGEAAAAVKLTPAAAANGGVCTVTALKSPAAIVPVTFTLTARATDGSDIEVSRDVKLLPLITNIDLCSNLGGVSSDLGDWDYVEPGATVYYDLNDSSNWIDPSNERAGYLPYCVKAASMQGIAGTAYSVKTSDARGAYAAYSGTAVYQELSQWSAAPTGKTGKVTVTVTATDGSGVKTVFTLVFGRYAQDLRILDAKNVDVSRISPPMPLLSGKALTFKTDIASDRTLTDKAVVWTVTLASGGDASAFATINAAGRLTTKPVTKQVTLDVMAAAKANPWAYNVTSIRLQPAVQAVSVHDDTHDEDVYPGQTIRIDLPDIETQRAGGYTLPTLEFRSAAYPSDAKQDVTWTASGPVSIDQNGLVTVKWNARGNCCMTGTATVTCKAADGSGKSVSFKIAVGIPVTSIAINGAPADGLRSGKYVQLTAVTTPNKPTVGGVTWSIEGSEYATVSATGRVTAKTVYEEHTVRVTATAKDGSGVSESVSITVKPVQDERLQLMKESDPFYYLTKRTLSLNVGGSCDMLVNYLVVGSSIEDVTDAAVYTSSNPAVATVAYDDVNDKCVITALKNGTSVITVTYTTPENKKLTAQVTVKVATLVSGVTVTGKGFAENETPTVASGKSLLMQAAVAPTGASKAVTWMLGGGDEGYAKISAAGLLTAMPGLTERASVQAFAYAKDGSGAYGSCYVELTPLATGVDIRSSSGQAIGNGQALGQDEGLANRTLTVDTAFSSDRLFFGAHVYPYNDTQPRESARQDVVWTSTNPRIASFADKSAGALTLNGPGTVTIKAAAMDGSGKSASFKLVIVKNPKNIAFQGPQDSNWNYAVAGGSRLTLKPVFEAGVTNKGLTWSIPNATDRAFASVSAAGVVTTKKVAQQTLITVQVKSKGNPSLTYPLDVLIYPAATGVTILYNGQPAKAVEEVVLNGRPEGSPVFYLSAECSPFGAGGGNAFQRVTWTSSNRAITVGADGSISGTWDAANDRYKPGTAVITAKAADGSGKTARVTLKLVYRVESLTLNVPDNTEVKVGRTLALKATPTPAYATNKAVTWFIDPGQRCYATVSAAGVVTPKRVTSPHDITVFCDAKDGGTDTMVTLRIVPAS